MTEKAPSFGTRDVYRQIKERASFETILDHYGIAHRGNGAQRTALCPFHDDTTPSLSVNCSIRVFYCHACGAKGDLFVFVARLANCSIREAAIHVADWCGIPWNGGKQPQDRTEKATEKHSGEPSEQGRRTSQEALSSAPNAREEANKPLAFTLTLDPSHPYLKNRGLSADSIETFGLGYCSFGLLTGRIAIPIYDECGRLVAYAGRWPGDDLPTGEPRYKLPQGFRKIEVLYNLHRVARAEHVVIVEGYWSVFRLHALGVPAVALMGCTLSPMQEEHLACSEARFLTLMLDGDDPGRSATAELIPRLVRNWYVHSAVLPDGEQPDTVETDELRRVLWSL